MLSRQEHTIICFVDKIQTDCAIPPYSIYALSRVYMVKYFPEFSDWMALVRYKVNYYGVSNKLYGCTTTPDTSRHTYSKCKSVGLHDGNEIRNRSSMM